MEFDLASQPEIVQQAAGYAIWAFEEAKRWLLSPEAWVQFGLLIGAYLLAVIVTRKLRPFLTRILAPNEAGNQIIGNVKGFLLMFVPLILPLLAFMFTSIGEQVVKSLFDNSTVIAFGKRVFIFLAARIFVREILRDPFLKLLGKYALIPMAGLYALGIIGPVVAQLEATVVPLGNLSFSIWFLLRFIVIGGIIFWLGQWSNSQSSNMIKSQEEMRPAMRELSAKAAEIAIFGVAFLVLMNIMGISLTSLAVLGGAVGVGLGFGLQKIASNFISGVILLLEGQATVGDYVELDGGEQGKIVKMLARAAILETFDGRWIVVPNEDFIVTRVVNYSDSGSANRYEVPFSVSYDTDINKVPDIIEAAVAKHAKVLSKPYPPDCELRALGDSGIEFAVEFWVNGLDDGDNKFTSDVLFIVWNALKDNDIAIPYPHRTIEFKGDMPKLKA